MYRTALCLSASALCLLSLGCPAPPGSGGSSEVDTIFGSGDHTLEDIEFSVIATADDDLLVPRDLAFHPDRPTELWVANRGDDPGDESMVILDDPGTDDQEATRFISFGNQHFLARVASIAFSENGNLASIHETDEPTQGPPAQGGSPADFMGPTLWSSDRAIFDAGHGGHLDMLHSTVNGMGVEAYEDNAFWVFEGGSSSIALYDFNEDHGPGGSDHSDGEIFRYVEGEVDRKSDVPSHMYYDAGSELLYIADSGNNRVAVLDTSGAEEDGRFNTYDGTPGVDMDGAEISTFVDGEEINMREPCGIARFGDVLYVSDNRTGILYAFDMDGGMIDWLDLERERGGLMGITFDGDGVLYAADAASEEILRIDFGAE